MNEPPANMTTNGYDAAAQQQRSRLSFDLDVDIAVVGAGLAGLTVALEAARLGASIAVLEGRHVGWGASSHHLGSVMPGFGLPVADLIERVGIEDARELWALSKEGAEYVRATATEEAMPGIALSEGALEVSNVDAGEVLISRLQTLSGDLDTEVEGWQVDRVRSELREYLSSVCERHFKTDATAKEKARLAQLVGAALEPYPREHADIVLHGLEPIRETDGFTSQVLLSEQDAESGKVVRLHDPYDERVIRRVMNAGATAKAVAPDLNVDDKYYVTPLLYETLLMILSSSQPNANFRFDKLRHLGMQDQPGVDEQILAAGDEGVQLGVVDEVDVDRFRVEPGCREDRVGDLANHGLGLGVTDQRGGVGRGRRQGQAERDRSARQAGQGCEARPHLSSPLVDLVPRSGESLRAGGDAARARGRIS